MNVIKKVWGFVKPYIFRYYVAFFCGGVVWMLLDVYVTKGIDASFVSACMDAVMALVAVLAIIKAKQIWDEKGKDVGHQYVMKLLTEVVPTLNIPTSTSINLRFIEANILNIFSKPSKTTTEAITRAVELKKIIIKECFDEINSIREYSINEMNKSIYSCDNLLSQINMCGISVSSGIAGCKLESQINNYREYTFLLSQLCYDLDSAFQLFKSDSIYKMKGSNYPDIESFMDLIDMNTLTHCFSMLSDLKTHAEDIERNISKLKKGKYKPSEYFDF